MRKCVSLATLPGRLRPARLYVTQPSLGSPSPSHSWLWTPVRKQSLSQGVCSSSPCRLATLAIRRTTRLHMLCTAYAGGKHGLFAPPCWHSLFGQAVPSMKAMSYERFFPWAQTSPWARAQAHACGSAHCSRALVPPSARQRCSSLLSPCEKFSQEIFGTGLFYYKCILVLG